MQVIEISRLPHMLFGRDIHREIRLVASPWTTGSDIVIVHVTLPPGGISEGHVHDDADESILFNNPGIFAGESQEQRVAPGTVIIVPKGEWHECRNPSKDSILTLYCVFSPAFKPYGAYPELIEKTKEHLACE
jgi:quercetin dioxygenase-like cupin family protein